MGTSFLLFGLLLLVSSFPEKSFSIPVTTNLQSTDQSFIVSTTPQHSGESWEVDNGFNHETTLPPLPEKEMSNSINKLKDDSTEEGILKGNTDQGIIKQTKGSSKPELYSFKIHSDITYRYARTYVTSRVVNSHPTDSQEVTFRVVLPETAFISKFIMEIDGKPYEAYVKEKEEAKRVYVEAQSQGQSAGLVELNTRNANVFNVNVNIKSQSKVNFNLTYEELLSRRLGRYEQAISITPDQITNVKDFQITVTIEESQNITLLRVPNLRNYIEAQQDAEGNNQDAIIERPAGNKANITWRPSEKDQSQLAKQGITGKFIVQYDIKRELDAGEVLVMNGYFVHFFAPANLPPLRKHVVFVLDTSGSMWGRRMEQLKEAMNQILADLTSDDFFNIFTFASEVVLWSPDDKISQSSSWSPPPFHGERVVTSVEDPRKRQPYPATPENIAKAQAFIQSLVASGGTNIHDSIVQALNLTAAIKKARESTTTEQVDTVVGSEVNTTTSQPETTTAKLATAIASVGNILPNNVESLLMFLTDGEPTVGITNPTNIQTLIQAANKNISVPIFSLAFGDGADFPFVRKLSLQNNGFARKIYEASDAALQLKGFYKEIASPLLSNVKFNYTTPESAYSVENLTVTTFPTLFSGTEIAVAGKLVAKPALVPQVSVEEIALTEEPEGESTPTPDSDDAESEIDSLLKPTNNHYFDVEIDASGRNGDVHFLRPEVFSCGIPWGIPIVRPFPPRPTPAPTREDVFLERLWAYLTIQQLIEKDIARDSAEDENEIDDNDVSGPVIPLGSSSVSILPTPSALPPLDNKPTTIPPSVPSPTGNNETSTDPSPVLKLNKTETPETPKQKALRLALKYGFVTSLTSLVVVKPNSSDVTDAKAADGKPDAADSFAAPQSLSVSFNKKAAFVAGGGFVGNRISGGAGSSGYLSAHYASVPLSLSQSSFQSLPGLPGPPGMISLNAIPQSRPILSTTRPYQHSTIVAVAAEPASVESQDYDMEIPSPSPTPPPTFIPTSTVRPSSTPSCNTVAPSLPEEVTTTENEDGYGSKSNLTLADVTWYKGLPIDIDRNGMRGEYEVVTSSSTPLNNPSNCTVESTGKTGQCIHLKDCVQSVFLDDFELYSKSYFCPIESTVPFSAGVCCV